MIVVGGEALVDLVEDRDGRRAVAGGGPFNTAVALGRLGVSVGFLGAISRDDYGTMLASELRAAAVDTSLIRWSDAGTATAFVERHADGGNRYTFDLADRAFADLMPADLPSLPPEAWALYLGTLSLAIDPPAAAYEALVERELGQRKVVLDPNVRPEIFGDAAVYRRRFARVARRADVIKLSTDDAAWLYPGLTLSRLLETILSLGPRIVAITRGADGAVAATADTSVETGGIRVTVADTVGAGDSFGAALIAALLADGAFGPGIDLPPAQAVLDHAVKYAVAASAITCTRAGAVPPTHAEISRLLGSQPAA